MKTPKLALIPIVLFTLFIFNANDVFASSCSTFGNTTYCDDGSSYARFGNTIYGSDGTSYTTFGNTTYGSDGSSATTFGNTAYTNDGTSYSRFGNSIYGSDGSSYSTFGNTTYGSGNTYSTCPANSSEDSLTGKCLCNYGYSVNSSKTSCVYTGITYTAPATPTCPLNSYYDGVSSCKCNYGYIVSGSSCVYQGTRYSNAPTYSSTQYTCPINSHTSATDSTKCQCDSGFQGNLAKDGCVAIPNVPSIDTTSLLTVCVAKLGAGATLDSNNFCSCKTSYHFNSSGNHCDQNQTLSCSSYGSSSYLGTDSKCYCNQGYEWNVGQTQCVQKTVNIFGKIRVYTNKSKATLVYQFKEGVSARDFTTKRRNLFFDWSYNPDAEVVGYYAVLSEKETMSNDLANFKFSKQANLYATGLRGGTAYNLYVKALKADGSTAPVKYLLKVNIK